MRERERERDWAGKPLVLFKKALDLAKLHHSLGKSEMIGEKI